MTAELIVFIMDYWPQCYAVIGLSTLLGVLISARRENGEDYETIHEQLGIAVLVMIVGWPYVWIIKLFSFEFWLWSVRS